MKRILIVCIVAMLVFSIAGCAPNVVPPASEAPAASSVDPEAGYIEPPMDTAMYRGVIESISEEGGNTILQLKQVDGTDFGAPELKAVINADSKMSVKISELEVGNYVEVYFGGVISEQVNVIVLNKLTDAELSVFTGKVSELNQESDTSGSMMVTAADEREILFSYDESTKLYLNIPDLKDGDTVNIFFSGATTMSIPPQAFAMEIRQVNV